MAFSKADMEAEARQQNIALIGGGTAIAFAILAIMASEKKKPAPPPPPPRPSASSQGDRQYVVRRAHDGAVVYTGSDRAVAMSFVS